MPSLQPISLVTHLTKVDMVANPMPLPDTRKISTSSLLFLKY